MYQIIAFIKYYIYAFLFIMYRIIQYILVIDLNGHYLHSASYFMIKYKTSFEESLYVIAFIRKIR